MSAGETVLAVESLVAGYGSREVLHGISLQAARGQIAVMLGHNGAGKTTTLNAIMGIDRVRKMAGTVRLNGEDVTKKATPEVVRRGVALVPEGGRVFADFTVRRNLELGGYTLASRGHVDAAMERVLTRFPLLGSRLNQLAGTLSGGERQTLAIARALMMGPQLLLLEEPFLGLSPSTMGLVLESLVEIRADGIACLIVEHNIQILSIADHAYVITLGEIVISESDPSSLLRDDRLEIAYMDA